MIASLTKEAALAETFLLQLISILCRLPALHLPKSIFPPFLLYLHHVHIHYVYSSYSVHIHYAYLRTSLIKTLSHRTLYWCFPLIQWRFGCINVICWTRSTTATKRILGQIFVHISKSPNFSTCRSQNGTIHFTWPLINLYKDIKTWSACQNAKELWTLNELSRICVNMLP